MTKSIPSLLVILISSLAAIIEVTSNAEFIHPAPEGFRSHWLVDSHDTGNAILKKWSAHKRVTTSDGKRPASSSIDILHSAHPFKGSYYPECVLLNMMVHSI